MLAIGAYIRLSPTNEDQVSAETGSLSSHPKRLEEYVKSRNSHSEGWGQIFDFYVDKDYSGKDTNRPELHRLLQDIVDGRVNAVLVTELARLSRNTLDFLRMWQVFEKYGVQFISLREQFDTTTAAGRMMLLNMVNFAQYEREQTVERIKANNRSRAHQGLASSAQRHVLGYDPHPTTTGSLVPNKKEAAQVKAIFEAFLEKGTLQSTAEELYKRGFRTKEYLTKTGNKKGGRRITFNSLFKILVNRAYIGEREFNKRNAAKRQEALQPGDRYEVVKAVWPAIIPRELFLEVQKKLEENNRLLKNSREDPVIYPYILTGLVRCGVCNENLAGRSAKGRGGHYHYYSHRPRRKGEPKAACSVKRVRAEKIEKAVVERLRLLAKDEDLVAKLVDDANQEARADAPEARELLQAVRADLKAVTVGGGEGVGQGSRSGLPVAAIECRR